MEAGACLRKAKHLNILQFSPFSKSFFGVDASEKALELGKSLFAQDNGFSIINNVFMDEGEMTRWFIKQVKKAS